MAIGTATITVTSVSDPTKIATCVVTVKENYVVIDNLKFAIGNLVANGSNGCKIGTSSDHGLYFHFGSLVGWAGGATGDGVGVTNSSLGVTVQVKPVGYGGSTSWPVGYYKGNHTADNGYNLPATDDAATGIGDPCRYYLGTPWRTPTAAEYLTLIGAGGVNTNKAVPLKLNSYDLSFSASGRRNNVEGALKFVGSVGSYWSSSVYTVSPYVHYLSFSSGTVNPTNYDNRPCGLPVRCVMPI